MHGVSSNFSFGEDLLTQKVREASRGTFVLIPTCKGWKLITFSLEEWGHDVEVENIWPLVAKAMTFFWLKPLNLQFNKFQTLSDQLAACPLALPRGRVQSIQGWHVFWANNFPPECSISKEMVESAFGLDDVWVQWQISDQEQCNPEQKQEFRKILKLTYDWPEIG